jgi:hypothetical protein
MSKYRIPYVKIRKPRIIAYNPTFYGAHDPETKKMPEANRNVPAQGPTAYVKQVEL